MGKQTKKPSQELDEVNEPSEDELLEEASDDDALPKEESESDIPEEEHHELHDDHFVKTMDATQIYLAK